MEKVKVASLAEALKAGFKPDNGSLVGNKSQISQGVLASYQGRLVLGESTDAKDYPFIVDGQPFPAELIYPRVDEFEWKSGKYDVYADGTVVSQNQGTVYPRDQIEAFYKAGKQKA